MSTINLASYKALGISGPIGAGKTTIAKRLASDFGANRVHFGTLVKTVAEQRNLPLDRRALQNLGEALIEELGPQQFVEETVIRSHINANNLLIFDGVRHVSIWEAIIQLTKQASLLYLQIPNELSIQRLIERDNISPGEAQKAIEHPQEAGIRKLEQVANLLISWPLGDAEWSEILAAAENFFVDCG